MDNQLSTFFGAAYKKLKTTLASKDTVVRLYESYMVLVGILGHFIFVLQTHKMLVTKNASNVSLEGFCISFAAIVSWLLYGFLKKDKVLIAVNAFGFITSLICIIVIIILS